MRRPASPIRRSSSSSCRSSSLARRLAIVLAVACGCLLVVGGIAAADAVAAGGDGAVDRGVGTTDAIDPAAASHPTASAAAAGRIVELYPNPTTENNRGEYVVVEIDDPGEWTLTDGEGTATLSAEEPGRFAVTRHPEATAAHTDATPVEAPGGFRLAVGGETLELAREGDVVDSVSYEDAPESHRWRVDADPHWQPDGFEPRDPATVTDVAVEAFVLPDSPDAVLDAIEGADRRLYLAAYTLTDERVADELIAAHDRGADVVVLVEGGPVGGTSESQAATLDRLTAAGVDVRVMTGGNARFRYHHAKYAVADDRAVVLTENWKPSGVGGADSRGWGLAIDDAAAADELAAVFAHDTTWADTPAWASVRGEIDPVEAESASGSYPRNHPPETTTAADLTVLSAPDNAEAELVELLDSTDEELLVVQPTIDADYALLEAAIRAADRGVDVRILLDSSWYAAEENRALADELAERSPGEGSLDVRLADGEGRFGKIHAKGIVADDTAVVGSLNWNDNAAENNRELLVAVDDPAVADYYRSTFEGDWHGDDGIGLDAPPTGVVVVGLGAAGAAVLVAARRLRFVE